ncbi:MAG TPA: tetratricopeptide repeat protein, partial [bacterium]
MNQTYLSIKGISWCPKTLLKIGQCFLGLYRFQLKFDRKTACLGVLAVQLFLVCPASADSFRLKIGQWFAEGKTAEIEEAINEKLVKDSGQVDLWLELADLRKSQGNNEGAVAAYQRYLSQKSDWKVERSVALSFEQMGRFANAEPILQKLYKEHPKDPDTLWGLAQLRYYQSKWKKIRTQTTARDALLEAQKILLKLVELKPDFALGLWKLAEVSRGLGDGDRALRAYRDVLKQDASYKLVHRQIAGLLAQKGSYREALARYEKATAV